jgi:hypothetical protein
VTVPGREARPVDGALVGVDGCRGEGQLPLAPVLEPRLVQLFQLVNDWLKFAETKNAALVAFAAAANAGILSFLGSSYQVSSAWKYVLLLAVCLFCVGCVSGLVSFDPKVDRIKLSRKRKKRREPSEQDNLWFFGEIGHYTPDELLRSFATRYHNAPECVVTALEKDIASQIIANARITIQKFRVFKWGLRISLVAVALITASLIVDLVAQLAATSPSHQ